MFNHVAHAWKTTTQMSMAAPQRSSFLRAVGDGYTVYALSSAIPDGGCGVAVTRITGKESLKILELLANGKDGNKSGKAFKCAPRVATVRSIYDIDSAPIDQAITIYFPGPNSYTGEDVVEIQTHGSTAVISQLFEAIRNMSKNNGLKVRQAERGEFTRRAFYNNKVDLTQAEAVREIIGSETALEMGNAALKIHGQLSQVYSSWTNRLNTILARVEARIEFEEQASTDMGTTIEDANSLKRELMQLATEIRKKVKDNKGELINMGATVAIVGPPNAGKSTLINTICNRKVAIVADMPGTTRDLVQVKYDLHGMKVTFVDTAGIRVLDKGATDNSQEGIERQGIEMALEYIKDAKMVLFLFDHTNMEDSKYALELTIKGIPKQTELVICLSKADLLEQKDLQLLVKRLKDDFPQTRAQTIPLSNQRPQSLETMLEIVSNKFMQKYQDVQKQPFITEARHKTHLMNVLEEIESTLQTIDSGTHDLEIIAENIREAISQISYIVGEQTNEEMLDSIFKTFCVGK
ncbi:tRNA modification GTPase [Babesia ovis]|uniref:tRNA modification GTPase n=1 Tax=Babesia ovis TaxID=5869 RepID=A0A9W5WTB9_BABOV|nr:tRNA modification GTPase [Babesia ovis]